MGTSSADPHILYTPPDVSGRRGSVRRTLRRLIATDGSIEPLILRLALGIVMLPHGAQKVLGLFGGAGLAATMTAFTRGMGIPAPLAALAIAAEFLGALGLLVGLLTRVAALGIAAVMAVAIVTVHLPNGFFMNWSGAKSGEGFEFHILALAIALALMLRGGGALSLDRVWARHRA